MKLSRREKVLIIILIIALTVYAGYMFIPSSGMFNLDELRAEHSHKTLEYDNMSKNITLKSSYEEDVQILTEQINNMPVISNLQQEKLIVFLNKYLADNNINANNLSFTDAAAVPMSIVVPKSAEKEKSSMELLMCDINNTYEDENEGVEKSVAANAEEANEEEAPSISAKSISVNIDFSSTYNDMIKFIDAIQNNAVDISITNISTVASEGGALQGTMTMNFYEVPKPIEFQENNDEWLWKDLAESGKANPFSEDGAGYFGGVSGSSYDFYMSVVPESSDLPTVMLGKAGDTERMTYVYADSNSVENISLSFKKESNKYYYKYSTKNSMYPAGGGWSEFIPLSSEDINLKIYSSTRNSKTDSAGANVSVSNTSGLKIRIDIDDDDSLNPRISFKEPKELIITR